MALSVLRAPPGLTHAFLPTGVRRTLGPSGLVVIDSQYASALINGGFQIPMPEFADDFVGADYTIPSVATVGMRYIRKNQGAGDLMFVSDVAGGAVAVSLTSASAKQEGALFLGDQRTFDLSKGVVFEARIKLATLPTSGSKFFAGLIGDYADGPDAITYSAFIAANGSGALLAETDDNVTDNSVATGVTATTAEWHDIMINAIDKNNIEFYVDGVQVATSTTFAFTAVGANAILQPYIGIYKASGTSVGTVQVDWVRVYSGR